MDNPWGDSTDSQFTSDSFSAARGSLDYAGDSWNDTSTRFEESKVENSTGGWGIEETFESTTVPTVLRSPSPSAALEEISPLESPKIESPIIKPGKDWGNYGAEEEELPPLVRAVQLDQTEEQDWNPELQEWKSTAPRKVSLPSFGDSFDRGGSARSEEKVIESGWGGNDEIDWSSEKVSKRSEVTDDWNGRPKNLDGVENDMDNAGEEEWTQSKPGKSISAAFINELKSDSQAFGNENWKPLNGFDLTTTNPGEMVLEPVNSTLPSDTPLSSLFRLSTAAPAFREGLEKTAQKAAATLIGGSNSIRNAKFGQQLPRGNGRTSIVGEAVIPPKPIGRAGDEFDLDAPSKVGGWFSKESTATNSTSRPSTADSVAPSAIGRFFGRFSKPTTHSASSDSNSRSGSPDVTYNEAEEGTVTKVSIDISGEPMQGSDFDAIFGEAITSQEINVENMEKDGMSGRINQFDIMGESSKSKLTKVKMKNTANTFDPFGADDENNNDNTSLSLQPTRPSLDMQRTHSLSTVPRIPPLSTFSSTKASPSILAPALSTNITNKSLPVSTPEDDFFAAFDKPSSKPSIPVASKTMPPQLIPTNRSILLPPPPSSSRVPSPNFFDSPESVKVPSLPPAESPLALNKPVVNKSMKGSNGSQLSSSDLKFFEDLL